MRQTLTYTILFATVTAISGCIFFLLGAPHHASSASDVPITGYAWSETIGWISLNCSNDSSCGTSDYGLSVDDSNNKISGYAWSENIGYISANASDVAGCPTAPCQPKISSSGDMSGWLKAISGDSAQGWDGWISLSCSNTGTCGTVDYGPTEDVGGNFSGYAWGSDVVGWIDFAYAHTAFACTPSTFICTDSTHISNGCSTSLCPYVSYGYGCDSGVTPNTCKTPPLPGGSIAATPNLTHVDNTVQVIWSTHDVDPASCTVKGSNADEWDGIAASPPLGMTSSPIVGQTTYKITCNGIVLGTFEAKTIVNIVPKYKGI